MGQNISVSLNSAGHPVRCEEEGEKDVRPTLMLISASNSKNEVNKFNVSAIVVREEEEPERQMPAPMRIGTVIGSADLAGR